jgi:hypothetical protein
MRVGWVLLVAGLLFACGGAEPRWIRADGKPIVAAQLEMDHADCRGQTQKASLTAAQISIGVARFADALEQDQVKEVVFIGCMAGKGYLRKSMQ